MSAIVALIFNKPLRFRSIGNSPSYLWAPDLAKIPTTARPTWAWFQIAEILFEPGSMDQLYIWLKSQYEEYDYHWREPRIAISIGDDRVLKFARRWC